MTAKNKKLLYIINHMDWFWSHRLPLAKGASENGWSVSVAATNAAQDQKLSTHNFTGLELPPSDQGFTPFTVLKTILAVRKLIKGTSPDLIHAITLKYAFITGLAALGCKDIKIVHTIAGLGYLFSGEGVKPGILRFLIGPFLKLALKGKNTQLIFQNPDDQALLVARHFVRLEQCHLIRGSGVDLNDFQQSPEPDDNSKNGGPIVLMPTRLVRDKGVAVFIEAARLLKDTKARFQIAGGETKNNPLAISKAQMEKMLEGSPVEWLGKVSNMPALLAKATLIVYPSYYREGIPKVLLEACATGRAIITTDHPGCREAVSHDENGLLVPVKHPAATAEAITALLENKERRQKMAVHSRRRAEQEFDVHLIVEKTLAVYSAGD